MYNPNYYLLDLDTSRSHIEDCDHLEQDALLDSEDVIGDLTPRVIKQMIIVEEDKTTFSRPRLNSRTIDNQTDMFMTKRASK
jgi:hypothetical protein